MPTCSARSLSFELTHGFSPGYTDSCVVISCKYENKGIVIWIGGHTKKPVDTELLNVIVINEVGGLVVDKM